MAVSALLVLFLALRAAGTSGGSSELQRNLSILGDGTATYGDSPC